MSKKTVFDSILSGLNEALEDAKKETPSLKRHRVTVIPLKEYEANDIKKNQKFNRPISKILCKLYGRFH